MAHQLPLFINMINIVDKLDILSVARPEVKEWARMEIVRLETCFVTLHQVIDGTADRRTQCAVSISADQDVIRKRRPMSLGL